MKKYSAVGWRYESEHRGESELLKYLGAHCLEKRAGAGNVIKSAEQREWRDQG